MAKPNIAKIETNVDAVLESFEKCEAGNCDGCAFEYMRRDLPAMCAFYQQQSARYLLKKLAEQTPRVMTLEEVKAIPYDADIWIETEYYVGKITIFAATINTRGLRGVMVYGSHKIYDYEAYNKLWRCWTARPTDEQRKAVPWE